METTSREPSEDINVDAAIKDHLPFIGVGVVVRDAFRLDGRNSPHLAECLAVRQGIRELYRGGFTNWVIESDAVNVINVVRNLILKTLEA
ncbi:hypothetical protein L484_006283 [Morus notabilis]|uniref:RNase H type-1 domain-containing protein n=1 Tax=Morus notabilis TaxID=981085 RepID=W9QUL1_9ROSA|nr:hypothetical protein L484_006283 [Morus notabilis]